MRKSGKKGKADPAKRNHPADRHSLFVREYLIDRNATQAAIRAGYSPKTARQQGARLLSRADVAAQVAAVASATLDRLDVTKERITRELAKIAFSDPRDYSTWGPKLRRFLDKNGVMHETSGVELIAAEDLEDDAAAAISEIGEGRQGIKIKLHDKVAALKMLGSELGMFRDRQPGDAPDNPFHLLVDAVQRHAAPLPIREQAPARPAPGADTRQNASRVAGCCDLPEISPLLRRSGGG